MLVHVFPRVVHCCVVPVGFHFGVIFGTKLATMTPRSSYHRRAQAHKSRGGVSHGTREHTIRLGLWLLRGPPLGLFWIYVGMEFPKWTLFSRCCAVTLGRTLSET